MYFLPNDLRLRKNMMKDVENDEREMDKVRFDERTNEKRDRVRITLKRLEFRVE